MTPISYSNIPYGTDGLQLVDVVVPASWNAITNQGVPPLGVVLWIHGGGWSGGDKSTETVPATIASAGYIVVNANYRLTATSTQDPSPTGFFPNNVSDIKTILRYLLIDGAGATEAPLSAQSFWLILREYVRQYGLVVSGASAGGHLSTIGVFEHAVDSGGVWPNAVVNFVGPMNLNTTGVGDPVNPIGSTGVFIINQYTQNNSTNVLLASPYYRRPVYQGISNYYTNNCQFYFWYNTNDTLVPLTSSIPFANALSSDLPGRVFITQVTEGSPVLGSGGYPTQYVADHYVVSDLGLVLLSKINTTSLFRGLTYPFVEEKLRPTGGQVFPRPVINRNSINTLTLSPNSSSLTKLANGNIELPSGTSNISYSVTFSVSGGSSPYRFSSSVLPAGLTLSSGGNLTGTPTVQGYYYFRVTAIDSVGELVYLMYQLTITGPAVSFTPPPLAIGDFRVGHYPTTDQLYFNDYYDYSIPGVGAGVGTLFNPYEEGGVVINKEGTYVYVEDEVLWVPGNNGFLKPTGADLQAIVNYWKLQGKGTVIAVTPAAELISGVPRNTVWTEARRADVIALDPYLLTGFIPAFNNNSTINQTSITNTINGLIAWTQSWITLAQSGGKQVILITQGIVEPSLASYVSQYLLAQYSTFTRSQIKQRVPFGIDLIGDSEQGSYVAVDVTPYQTAYPL